MSTFINGALAASVVWAGLFMVHNEVVIRRLSRMQAELEKLRREIRGLPPQDQGIRWSG